MVVFFNIIILPSRHYPLGYPFDKAHRYWSLIKDFSIQFWSIAISTHFSYQNCYCNGSGNYYNNDCDNILSYSILVTLIFSLNLLPLSLNINNFCIYSLFPPLYHLYSNCKLFWIIWFIVNWKLTNWKHVLIILLLLSFKCLKSFQKFYTFFYCKLFLPSSLRV